MSEYSANEYLNNRHPTLYGRVTPLYDDENFEELYNKGINEQVYEYLTSIRKKGDKITKSPTSVTLGSYWDERDQATKKEYAEVTVDYNPR
jgi:hypothetical protein